MQLHFIFRSYPFHSLVSAGLCHLSCHPDHLLTLLGNQFGRVDEVLLGTYFPTFTSGGGGSNVS